MRGRPLKHGPHWPADSRARYRATRAVSASPHRRRGARPAPRPRRPHRAGAAPRWPAAAAPPAPRAATRRDTRRRAPPGPGRRRSARWPRPAARPGPGPGGQPEQVRQAGAERHLGHAGAAVGQVQGDQHAARLRRGAGAAEPGRAVPRDQGQVGQRLHVLHQHGPARGQPRQPAHRPVGGQRGRPARRLASADSSPARNRSGAGHELDARGVHSRGGPLRDRRGKPGVQPLVARHVEHGGAGTGHPGGELEPVQHQVRADPQQGPVLAAGRLALGAVAHHDGGRPGLRRRGELAGDGKAAPPRPVSPAAATSAMRSARTAQGESGPWRARCARRSTGTAPGSGSSRGRPGAGRRAARQPARDAGG